jgi:hypothetical protein
MGYTLTIGKLGINMTDVVDLLNEKDNELETAPSVQYILGGYGWFMDVTPCEGEASEVLRETNFNALDNHGPQLMDEYASWGDFMRSCPATLNLTAYVFGPKVASDGKCFALNTDFVKKQLAALEKQKHKLTPKYRNRAQWLLFWAQEAITRYGNDAAIKFF